MRILTVFALFLMPIMGFAFAQAGTPTSGSRTAPFKGILCEGKKKLNGVVPMLLIYDLGSSEATLSLSLDDGLPDIRNSKIQRATIEGRTAHVYLAQPSSVFPSAPEFAVYSDGTTPQNTKNANLEIDGIDDLIEMTCRDGMSLRK